MSSSIIKYICSWKYHSVFSEFSSHKIRYILSYENRLKKSMTKFLGYSNDENTHEMIKSMLHEFTNSFI